MIINRVRLKNFRQYYGNNEIFFSVSKKRNVTVVHGENGVGKTALLNAIKWCFYGEFTSNFRNPEALINFEAVDEGAKECGVEIEFTEGDSDFLAIRTFNSNDKTKRSPFSGNLRLFKKDGVTYGPALPDPELVINGMLPKEMSNYFFFQGEGSNAVEAGKKGINLKKSVRNILGFRVAEEALNDLRVQSNKIKRTIAQLDTSGKAQEVAGLIEKLSDEQQELTVSIEELSDRIPELESDLDKVEEELNSFESTSLSQLRNEERELETNLRKREVELNRFQTEKYKHISIYGWALFGEEFASDSLEFIDESTLKGRLPEPYNKTFITDILSSEKCICGACLEPGSDAYNRISRLLDKAANPNLQNRLSGVRAQIQNIATLSSMAGSVISTNLDSIRRTEEDIQTLKSKLKKISDRISEIPEEKVKSLQAKKLNLRKDISEQSKLLGRKQERLSEVKRILESKEKQLKGLSPNNDVLKDLEKKLLFVNSLRSSLETHLKNIEEKVRLHIAAKVNRMMEQYSRHSYRIKVAAEEFEIVLVDHDDNLVGQGDGLNLLLNLSIISALIEYVREEQGVSDPLLSSASVAPLVIDAPFGVLDESYRNVVVENLPTRAEQVIFFVSSSQWTEEMNKIVEHKVGEEFCLILEEREDQGDRSVDRFTIRGKEIVASRYGCDRNRVVIEEVQ